MGGAWQDLVCSDTFSAEELEAMGLPPDFAMAVRLGGVDRIGSDSEEEIPGSNGAAARERPRPRIDAASCMELALRFDAEEAERLAQEGEAKFIRTVRHLVDHSPGAGTLVRAYPGWTVRVPPECGGGVLSLEERLAALAEEGHRAGSALWRGEVLAFWFCHLVCSGGPQLSLELLREEDQRARALVGARRRRRRRKPGSGASEPDAAPASGMVEASAAMQRWRSRHETERMRACDEASGRGGGDSGGSGTASFRGSDASVGASQYGGPKFSYDATFFKLIRFWIAAWVSTQLQSLPRTLTLVLVSSLLVWAAWSCFARVAFGVVFGVSLGCGVVPLTVGLFWAIALSWALFAVGRRGDVRVSGCNELDLPTNTNPGEPATDSPKGDEAAA